jgi:hypothetical protein
LARFIASKPISSILRWTRNPGSFTLCKRNVCRNSQNAPVYYYSEASNNCDDPQHVRGFFRALWELNAENMYEVQTDDVTENCWKLHKEEYRCDIKYEETSTEHAACLGEWEKIQTIVSQIFFFARGPLSASKNNHGSSHPFWRKYSQFWWQVSKIRYLFLWLILDRY